MSPEQQVKLFSTQNACQNNIRKNPIAQKLISEKPELAQHECATGENLGDGEFGGSLSQAQSHSSALLVGVLSSSDKGVEALMLFLQTSFHCRHHPIASRITSQQSAQRADSEAEQQGQLAAAVAVDT